MFMYNHVAFQKTSALDYLHSASYMCTPTLIIGMSNARDTIVFKHVHFDPDKKAYEIWQYFVQIYVR